MWDRSMSGEEGLVSVEEEYELGAGIVECGTGV